MPDRVTPFDDSGCVAAVTGHVVLYGADLAASVGGAVGRSALELIDQARGLEAGARWHERDAALEGELAQVALLASGRLCSDRFVEPLLRATAAKPGRTSLLDVDEGRPRA